MVEEVEFLARPLESSRVRGQRTSMRSLTVGGTVGRFRPVPGRDIPTPDFPVRPTLSLKEFVPTAAPPIPSVIDAGANLHVTAGRVAIALALKAMGLREGDKVLIPACHCLNMVEPLSYTGSLPVFYRIKENLAPDLSDIASKVTPRTRALMVTHYFGFLQDILKIRQFCDAHGLLLLEDCAHAYFGQIGGRPVGSVGHFAIASHKKFFPVFDGGSLIVPAGSAVSFDLRPQSLSSSLKAAVDQVQKAVYYGNLPAARPLLSAMKAGRNLARRALGRSEERRGGGATPEGINPSVLESGSGGEFNLAWIDVAMTGYSQWVVRHLSFARVIARRRRNYAQMVTALDGLAGCRALFPVLPDGVVPYEVPFWVDDLDRKFAFLEDRGVPMHRLGQFLYPKMPEGTCPFSEALAHHLVQFPCHQDLSVDDIWQIAGRIRAAMAA